MVTKKDLDRGKWFDTIAALANIGMLPAVPAFNRVGKIPFGVVRSCTKTYLSC